MLELENRTEAVLEAVGDRGEVLALAHGQDNDYNLSVAIVRAGGRLRTARVFSLDHPAQYSRWLVDAV